MSEMTAPCSPAAIRRIARARDSGATLAFVPEGRARTAPLPSDQIKPWSKDRTEVAVAVRGGDVIRIFDDGYAERLEGDERKAVRFRSMDSSDVQAFSGVESDDPQIAYLADNAVILDGDHLELVDGDGHTMVHRRKVSRAEADEILDCLGRALVGERTDNADVVRRTAIAAGFRAV